MKTWLVGILVLAIAAVAVPTVSEAKRLGAGKSSGMQRDMPARTSPDATPAKPAAPAQATAPTAGAAAAPAAAAKRSWMGPLAGLAAGLGLAALMSHLGMGEGMANFLMIALLAVAAFFVIRLLMRRFGPQPMRPAATQFAGAGAGAGGGMPGQVAWPTASSSPTPAAAPVAEEPAAASVQSTASVPAVARAFVPASFDSEGFGRTAKMIFIRLQAANDTRDLADLRNFTTPEMFAAIKMDLQDRGDTEQHTDVVRVDADVLDVADEAASQVVSVRFHGLIREVAGTEPTAFDEVWHLSKPHDDSRNWAIAGIEQRQ